MRRLENSESDTSSGCPRRRVRVLGALCCWTALATMLLTAPSAWADPEAVWPDRSAPLGPNPATTISGWNFSALQAFDIIVIRPDGTIRNGDGSDSCPGGAPNCWDTVTADGNGHLLDTPYLYLVGAPLGVYDVRVYASPWSGNLGEPAIATTSFFHSDGF